MGEITGIEWCHHTFNPWIGCTPVSPACDHCYAEALAKRYGWAKWGAGEPRRMASPAMWKNPAKWNRAAAAAGVRRRVFCASLADVFDAEVDDEWRVLLFEKILETPSLDWLLLTKRPQVAKKWFDAMPAPRNVWLGTTVEDQKMADLRIPILLSIPAKVRFLSCEPLLGPVDIVSAVFLWAKDELRRRIIDGATPQSGHLDWVIAGGESGPKARPSHPGWFRALRDQCSIAGVPFFFKQWGEHEADEIGPEDARSIHYPPGHIIYRKIGKKAAGAKLDGVEHREFPATGEAT